MPGAREAPPGNLGFLTVTYEPAGYTGGYLVTNWWGRPLEFRLSTAVQPNRVQQVLYGSTLEPYICADLIGKTLIDKTSTVAQAIWTDCRAALELRHSLEIPMACISLTDDEETPGRPRESDTPAIHCHPDFEADVEAMSVLVGRLNLDLTEPFGRIREAIAEARRVGVTARG